MPKIKSAVPDSVAVGDSAAVVESARLVKSVEVAVAVSGGVVVVTVGVTEATEVCTMRLVLVVTFCSPPAAVVSSCEADQNSFTGRRNRQANSQSTAVLC